ncbi:cyclic nucleotide-binding domain-containing protein [bacterium]|nr:cyclic nucleotide-binding domain-containing protein [bacterium]
MTDDVLPLLAVHEYFRGLPADALAEVARDARVAHHPAGAVVHKAGAVPDTVGFVLRGRLEAVRVDARGVETLFRVIDRGEQYGMMVGALAEPVPSQVVA